MTSRVRSCDLTLCLDHSEPQPIHVRGSPPPIGRHRVGRDLLNVCSNSTPENGEGMIVGGSGSIHYVKSGMQQGGTLQEVPSFLEGGAYCNGKKQSPNSQSIPGKLDTPARQRVGSLSLL